MLKSIDNIYHIIDHIFDIFGTSHISQIQDSKLALSISNYPTEISKDFCKNYNKITKGARIAQGGFGEIFFPKINNKNIHARLLSYRSDNGSWQMYELPIIIKEIKKYEDDNCIYMYNIRDDIRTLQCNDSLHESIINGLLAYAYDYNMTPHVVRSISYYTCPKIKKNIIVQEKMDQTFYQLLTDINFLTTLTIEQFDTFIFQIIYSLQVLYELYGFVHYDMHLGNIMIKLNNFYYSGYNSTNKNYLEYPLDTNESIRLPITRYLIKIGDMGLTSVDFKLSTSNTNVPYSIYPDSMMAGKVNNLKNAIKDTTNYPTVSSNFFIANVYYVLHAFQSSNPTYNAIIIPIKRHIENMSLNGLFPEININMIELFHTKYNHGFYSPRNMGSSSQSITARFKLYTNSAYGKQIYNKVGSTTHFKIDQLSQNNADVIPIGSANRFEKTQLSKFIKLFNSNTRSAAKLQLELLENFSAANTMIGSMFSTIDRGLWLHKPKITLDDLLMSGIKGKLISKTTGINQSYLHVFNIDLYPEMLQQNVLKYKYRHRTLNYNVPTNVNQFMDWVRIHLIYHKNMNYELTGKTDLYTGAKQILRTRQYGFTTNTGYFVVANNINNPLTGLTPANEFRPIGYIYNNIYGIIPHLSFPQTYNDDLAVFTIKNNKIKLYKYSTFLTNHTTIQESLKYYSGNTNNIITVNQPKISVPKPNLYDYAFTTGPILMWNNIVVFKKQKFKEEMITSINNTDVKYRISPSQKNYNKFYSEVGETAFGYGQRSSNNIHIHHIFCITNDGYNLDLFFEGRGYKAEGIDRVQVAYLCKKFNVKHAVSLDGGFSANAVIKNTNKSRKYKWIMPSPDHRHVGSMIVAYNK